jgi:hypothetical protein
MPAHVERLPDGAVRFSRTHPKAQPGRPVARLVFTRQEWVDFLAGVVAGEFDVEAPSSPAPVRTFARAVPASTPAGTNTARPKPDQAPTKDVSPATKETP